VRVRVRVRVCVRVCVRVPVRVPVPVSAAEDMSSLSRANTPAVAGNPGPDGVAVSGDCDVA